VAGADPFARGQDEEDGLDVLERRVDRPLHVLRERVERPLEPGQIRQYELIAVAVRDPEDPPARRLRLVRHDRRLAAAEGVHKRRLAHVGPPRDGNETRLQNDQVSGRRSAAVYVTTSPSRFSNVTDSIRNSYSH